MSKAAEQVYEIEGVKFRVRTDGYNARELERLNSLHNKLTASVNTISVNFSADELSELFSIILTPVDTVPEGFDFALAKEAVQIEIYKAFFLERLGMRTRFIKKLQKS